MLALLTFAVLVCLPTSYSFFFQRYRAHRHLPSFPTRRSSDLESGTGDLVPCGLGARDTLRLEAGMRLYGNDIDETTRSEEHTSELQSPDHLVCRLLLEKKKHRRLIPRHS